MTRPQTPATTATAMMMTVCMLVADWMLPRTDRRSSRSEPDGSTTFGTATFSAVGKFGAVPAGGLGTVISAGGGASGGGTSGGGEGGGASGGGASGGGASGGGASGGGASGEGASGGGEGGRGGGAGQDETVPETPARVIEQTMPPNT
jgi:hypothetical protein